jgi:hypothetical protein
MRTVALGEHPRDSVTSSAGNELAQFEHVEMVDVVAPQTAYLPQSPRKIQAVPHAKIDDIAAERADGVGPWSPGSSEGYSDLPLGSAHLFSHDLVDGPFRSTDSPTPQEVQDPVLAHRFLPTT